MAAPKALLDPDSDPDFDTETTLSGFELIRIEPSAKSLDLGEYRAKSEGQTLCEGSVFPHNSATIMRRFLYVVIPVLVLVSPLSSWISADRVLYVFLGFFVFWCVSLVRKL